MTGPIISRAHVVAAVNRALQMDPREDLGAAVVAVAESLCIPVEAVCECLQLVGEVVPC